MRVLRSAVANGRQQPPALGGVHYGRDNSRGILSGYPRVHRKDKSHAITTTNPSLASEKE